MGDQENNRLTRAQNKILMTICALHVQYVYCLAISATGSLTLMIYRM